MYIETPAQQQQRNTAFVYHPPTSSQPERYVLIREAGRQLSLLLNTNCPQSRELSLAQTNLEQVIFWANAAIARNEGNPG